MSESILLRVVVGSVIWIMSHGCCVNKVLEEREVCVVEVVVSCGARIRRLACVVAHI